MNATEQAGRWHLHRGGVVNVWQYSVEEFDLSGGRAIFQGTNGSGKSRTLELLLPLCLDGDLHQIGSKGFDTVSMRRLMLEDYQGGPNRIGYTWVELRRVTDGQTEYLTSGVGVKASATSQQISDSWRFITDRRVGHDFRLIAEEAPLGPTQLREVLGAECVYDEEAFRARIAELVYGIPAARYPDLLHLQRTLRNPDVGLKVLAGQLEQILADSLPPLDAALIEQLARSFDDLRAIRDNIEGLATADTALSAFLSSYRGYALGTLRTLGKRGSDVATALAGARADIRKLVGQLSEAEASSETAQAEVQRFEDRETGLEGQIDSLKNSPVYQSVRDLTDRKRAVTSARQAAVSALRQARAQRGMTDQLVEAVVSATGRLADDLTQATELAAAVTERLREAGLDSTLCPRVPSPPPVSTTQTTRVVRTSAEPEDAPTEVTSPEPPAIDLGALSQELGQAATSSEQALDLLRERAALALTLLTRARELEGEREQIDQLRREARDAQVSATEAAGLRNEALQRVDEAAHMWREAATTWTRSGPLARLPEDEVSELLPPEVTRLTEEREAARSAAEHAHSWMRKRLPDLHSELSAAERRAKDVDEAIMAAERDLGELRSGADPIPALPTFASAERDAASGAAFYRLVDFASGLDDQHRAGCEAALESCGLLNAWVTADGVSADPARPDLHAAISDALAGAAPAPRNLTEVLEPAVPPGSPVGTDTVRRLLEQIALDDDQAAGLSVSVTGTWRAGVLSGAMTKDSAEFVGAGARESARGRRIEELGATLRALVTERDELTGEVSGLRERLAEWEDHLDRYPHDRDLFTAHVTAHNARQTAEESGRKAFSLRSNHSSAAERYQARRAELTADIRAAGMDERVESLEAARAAAMSGRTAAEQLLTTFTRRCLGGVELVADALRRHEVAAIELTEAEREAETVCREYLDEKTTYDDRVQAIGGEAERLERDLAAAEEERATIRRELPDLRRRATEFSVKAGRTHERIRSKESAITELVQRDKYETERFRAALASEGLWAAALGEPADLPEDPADALAVLNGVTAPASSEDAVMNSLQKLQSALAGTHNVSAQRDNDVLTVTITSQHGRQPVAVAARDIAARLDEQRTLLSEEYQQIFDRFMLRDLADKLAGQIEIAEDLCHRMNETLRRARSSQGVHVQLEWLPTPDLDESMRQALKLIRKPFAKRTEEEDAALRQALTDRIGAERDGHSGVDYADVLERALDYRTWHRFTVRVRDHGPDAAPRSRRMRELSSGETRLISYVTLFAAASAFYDAVSSGAERPPLRLVLLDEAFERLDDPTIARMLGLLVDLDMDWIITWPSGWGLSEKIPRMHIYDILRPKGGSGIARTHAIWSGGDLAEEDV